MKAHCEKLEEEIKRVEIEIEEQRLRIPPPHDETGNAHGVGRTRGQAGSTQG